MIITNKIKAKKGLLSLPSTLIIDDPMRYPKLALEGYVHGQRERERPKKRWLDVVRSDCADMGLTVHDAIHLAQDRDAWRRPIAKLPLRAPAGASPRH